MGGAVPFLLPALRRHCFVCACQPYPNTQSDGSVEDDTSWKSSGPRQWGWTSCEWVEEELLLSCCDLQVVAAARSGHYAVGYELNLWLVLCRAMRALYHGVSKQTEFHRHDLWKVNLRAVIECVIIV